MVFIIFKGLFVVDVFISNSLSVAFVVQELRVEVFLKGWTLSFVFILRWMLTNLDLVVYCLKEYCINVLNGLKQFMTKLNH